MALIEFSELLEIQHLMEVDPESDPDFNLYFDKRVFFLICKKNLNWFQIIYYHIYFLFKKDFKLRKKNNHIWRIAK